MSKTPMRVKLIADTSMPNEVRKWISEFTTMMLRSLPPGTVLNRLVQMGVDPPNECGCKGMLDDPLWQWLHANHLRYNRAVWELITGSWYFEEVRTALELDVAGPDNMIGTQAFGTFVAKAYGRQLLDHFLRRDPNPEWVGADPSVG